MITWQQLSWGVLGFIPSLIWLTIFLRRDQQKPEPGTMITRAFLYGMLITPIAALGEAFFLPIILLPTLIIAAPIEEYLKYSIFKWKIKGSKFYDEPIDAMIYMTAIGLGFAAVENIILVIKVAPLLKETFNLLSIRFLSATLIHALCSANVGYFLAKKKFLSKGKLKKVGGKIKVIHGLLFAIFVHALYNYIGWQQGELSAALLGALLLGMFMLVSWQFRRLQKLEIRN